MSHFCQCQTHSGDSVRVWESYMWTPYPVGFSVVRALSFWFVIRTRKKNIIPACTQIHTHTHTNIHSLCQTETTNSIWTLKTFPFLILSFFFPFLQDFLAVSLVVHISKYLCWSVWVVFMVTELNYIVTDST